MSDDLLLPLDVPTPAAAPPLVVSLDDERALNPALVGAKAANLARAAAAGMHVVPGEVLTTIAMSATGAAGGLRVERRFEAEAAAWAALVVHSAPPPR